eukprot:TRINITY_DN9345_c0_g1_i1.p1 TRINITY_DN9345_c0_g1~~TRINITY_DN9345_c0_g1_i1.p1  ORF type:complete len:242 (+),score=49.28 TRINITY_DN9345_c0_g1_i1:49-774(+)
MASRTTLVLACALPLLALLVASQCVHVSADAAGIATVGSSSLTAAGNAADLAEFDVAADSDVASIRRELKSKKKDKKKKKNADAPAPAPEPEPTSSKSTKSKKGKKSPPPPPAPTTPAKGGKKGGKKNSTAPLVKKSVSAKDKTVIADLSSAAADVDTALTTLKTKTYTKSLSDTATALRNSVILINQGYQRELVPQQIANAIATIDGVSVMLSKSKEKKTLASLASAKASAQAASDGFTP